MEIKTNGMILCETNDELTKIFKKKLVDKVKEEIEKGGEKASAVPKHLSRIKHSNLSVKTFYLSKTNIYIQNALTENKFFSLDWFGLVGHCSINTHAHTVSVLTIFYYDQLAVES